MAQPTNNTDTINAIWVASQFNTSDPLGYDYRGTKALYCASPEDGGWITINAYGREITSAPGEPSEAVAVLPYAQVSSGGSAACGMYLRVGITGEETLIGIGGGVRFSFPAKDMQLSWALPKTPASFVTPEIPGDPPTPGDELVGWPYLNSGIQWNPAVGSIPFPQAGSGRGDVEATPISQTFAQVEVRSARPPVGDRLARLSHQLRPTVTLVDDIATLLGYGAICPVPSRARKVKVSLINGGQSFLGVWRTANNNVALVPPTYFTQTDVVDVFDVNTTVEVPTNAQWLQVISAIPQQEPPELPYTYAHIDWRLEI